MSGNELSAPFGVSEGGRVRIIPDHILRKELEDLKQVPYIPGHPLNTGETFSLPSKFQEELLISSGEPVSLSAFRGTKPFIMPGGRDIIQFIDELHPLLRLYGSGSDENAEDSEILYRVEYAVVDRLYGILLLYLASGQPGPFYSGYGSLWAPAITDRVDPVYFVVLWYTGIPFPFLPRSGKENQSRDFLDSLSDARRIAEELRKRLVVINEKATGGPQVELAGSVYLKSADCMVSLSHGIKMYIENAFYCPSFRGGTD